MEFIPVDSEKKTRKIGELLESVALNVNELNTTPFNYFLFTMVVDTLTHGETQSCRFVGTPCANVFKYTDNQKPEHIANITNIAISHNEITVATACVIETQNGVSFVMRVRGEPKDAIDFNVDVYGNLKQNAPIPSPFLFTGHKDQHMQSLVYV